MVHAFPVVVRFLKKGWLVALLLVWASAANAASTTLLVLGDSLSAAYGIEREAGWVNLLRQRLGDDVKVVNASISGETTAGGETRLPELLRQHAPDIVLIELGGNDGLRGLSPQQMRGNLSSMIEASQRAEAKVLLVGIEIPPNYGQAYTRAFRSVYRGLAEKYGVPLVPFLLDGIALDDGLMQDDGIHPTAEAQPRMLENVWPKLEPLLPKQARERVASH
ncbi:acyl-CoA thioesterase-1 [Modicisalibacter ilicicola DSM 19980]|uniref:Acyl-CoA thioesterase-1 n=1 Tax=Modicisalibacter ilicicola DSM 19980 TaxID=1121942 RepID=A0A1M4SY66_9GAMM|nr:arylesterase [Halomonas ilicicola]SHE37168.1 acyl-CoA thioesterase-1 [Halomonas ilicicola DSM 19980]